MHPVPFVIGLALAAMGAGAAGSWPEARRWAPYTVRLAAVGYLVVSQSYPAGAYGAVVGIAIAGVVLVAALARSTSSRSWRPGFSRPTGDYLAVVGVLPILVYFTVPDTEGAVLLIGITIAEAAAWLVAGWRLGPATTGLALGSAVGATGAVAVVSAAGRVSAGGWLLVKVALVVGATVTWTLTSGRARRSP
jgi:hypothetical protein